MRQVLTAIIFLLFNYNAASQNFIKAYKNYQLNRANALSNPATKKKVKSFIKSQCAELDTVFNSYKIRTHFNFNTADTLFLIYDAPADSPFTSDIIIWSGKDTISYSQGYDFNEQSKKNTRIVTYEQFIAEREAYENFKVITQRDSLITLVAKRDYKTINQLSDKQDINDGSITRIYVAYKNNGEYNFESCFPKKFFIWNVYRKK